MFLDVKVDDPELLKPNSTGEVTITVDAHPNATMIPRRALFDGDKVYVVGGGRIERRKVKAGFLNLTEVEILEGIKVGEPVIVDKLEQYRDGQRVNIEILP